MCDETSDLSIIINQHNPDLVFGSESWLHTNIKSCEIFLHKYYLPNKDRWKNEIGGSFFILVKNKLISVELVDYSTDYKPLLIKWKTGENKDLLIGSFYMSHPNSSNMDKLGKHHGSSWGQQYSYTIQLWLQIWTILWNTAAHYHKWPTEGA